MVSLHFVSLLLGLKHTHVQDPGVWHGIVIRICIFLTLCFQLRMKGQVFVFSLECQMLHMNDLGWNEESR